MNKNKNRPWLTPTGVEIPTAALRGISQSWDSETWALYLSWYESSRREAIVAPNIYSKRTEEMTESIFQTQGCENNKVHQVQCEHIFEKLTKSQAEVLRKSYLEGKTQIVIGKESNRSQTSIADLKVRGLRRAKRLFNGDNTFARRFMKGESFSESSEPETIWDQKFNAPLREARAYDPKKFSEELCHHEIHPLALACRELSEKELRALYLRFWCDFSVVRIGHELAMGMITAEVFIEITVRKLKTKILELVQSQPSEVENVS